jgi:Mn-dependent DtxR family transcriptional regulator
VTLRAISTSVDPGSASATPRFTEKQGQYLAFIYTYVLLNRQPPAEADFQRFFCVTPPTVHQMIVQLERLGLVRARSSCSSHLNS